MAAHVLAVNEIQRPVGLIPLEIVVSRLAVEAAEGFSQVKSLLVDENRRWRSKHLDLPTPVVVQWPGYIELPEADRARVSRRVLFARDRYQCQYCDFVAQPGKALKQLTVDHVKPAHLYASRAAATTWDNVTSACFHCNQRKAGLLPMKAHMWPRQTPKEPSFVQLRFAGRLNDMQRDYVRDYFALEDDVAL